MLDPVIPPVIRVENLVKRYGTPSPSNGIGVG